MSDFLIVSAGSLAICAVSALTGYYVGFVVGAGLTERPEGLRRIGSNLTRDGLEEMLDDVVSSGCNASVHPGIDGYCDCYIEQPGTDIKAQVYMRASAGDAFAACMEKFAKEAGKR